VGHKAEEGIKVASQRASEGVMEAGRSVKDGVMRVGEKVEEKKMEARALDEGENVPILFKRDGVMIDDPPRLGGLIGGRGPIVKTSP